MTKSQAERIIELLEQLVVEVQKVQNVICARCDNDRVIEAIKETDADPV